MAVEAAIPGPPYGVEESVGPWSLSPAQSLSPPEHEEPTRVTALRPIAMPACPRESLLLN